MTLYEIFFDIEISLSDRFPSLNPFVIRRTRAVEVFLLMNRMKTKKKERIKRKAKDDWF